MGAEREATWLASMSAHCRGTCLTNPGLWCRQRFFMCCQLMDMSYKLDPASQDFPTIDRYVKMTGTL